MTILRVSFALALVTEDDVVIDRFHVTSPLSKIQN